MKNAQPAKSTNSPFVAINLLVLCDAMVSHVNNYDQRQEAGSVDLAQSSLIAVGNISANLCGEGVSLFNPTSPS